MLKVTIGGFTMKSKRQTKDSPTKYRRKISSGDERKQDTRRQIWLGLVTAFLLISFLAAECATLLPVD
jgi:hypothetical protein